MVIEGNFSHADFTLVGNSSTLVRLELMLTNEETVKLQNALMNRRMDQMQMVINSAPPEAAPATDTPKTTSESW
jgi:hypothetical protein